MSNNMDELKPLWQYMSSELGINKEDYYMEEISINISFDNTLISTVYGDELVTLYKLRDYYIYEVRYKYSNPYKSARKMIMIKKEEFINIRSIVKKLEKEVKRLDKVISVNRYDDSTRSWVLSNRIKPKSYKPLISESLNQLVNRLKRINTLTKSGLIFNTNTVLIGPPGTGKTRFVLDVAFSLGLNIYCISTTDSFYKNGSSFERCIFLFEEIDKILDANGDFIDPNSVDVPALLSFIDGINRYKDTILIMTCNDYDRIKKNKVLSRKGRISKVYHFDTITFEQTKHMISPYYPDATGVQITQFYTLLPNKSHITIAVLSAFIQDCVIDNTDFANIDAKQITEYIDETGKGYHMYH